MRSEAIRDALKLDRREVPRVLAEGLKSKSLRKKGAKRATVYRANYLATPKRALPSLSGAAIRHFLAHHDTRWKKLADFDGYGRLHPVEIASQSYLVLPLAHPRQVSGLGAHSAEWRRRHDAWKAKAASTLL